MSKDSGIEIEKLAKEVISQLDKYGEAVDKATKLAVDKVARDVNKEITSRAKSFNNKPFKLVRYVMIKINGHIKRVALKTGRSTGKYVNSFKIKTAKESLGIHRKTWYVKSPMHSLSHLLENGHKYNINGKQGKTQAYPHIKYGEELAIKELPIEIEKRIKKIKGGI